jgi:elongation factor Ts
MEISLDQIKRLKDLTGVGLTDAKHALVESKGDFDKALEAMKKKGLTKAEKRGEREAKSGVVESYIHDSRIGALVEVNCETDFVAKTDEFKILARDIAIHVAAMNPEFISSDRISDEVKTKLKDSFIQKCKEEGKPEDKADMIAEGMLSKYFSERCMMDQPFAKNQDLKVSDIVKEAIAKLGENIVISKMARIQLGERIED